MVVMGDCGLDEARVANHYMVMNVYRQLRKMAKCIRARQQKTAKITSPTSLTNSVVAVLLTAVVHHDGAALIKPYKYSATAGLPSMLLRRWCNNPYLNEIFFNLVCSFSIWFCKIVLRFWEWCWITTALVAASTDANFRAGWSEFRTRNPQIIFSVCAYA